jgi:hypothetical protein
VDTAAQVEVVLERKQSGFVDEIHRTAIDRSTEVVAAVQRMGSPWASDESSLSETSRLMNKDFNLEEEKVNTACRHQSKTSSKSEATKKEVNIFLSLSMTSS